MPLTTGDVFAGYTIVRRLGSGGMGEVYLAQHPRLPRRDALKILPAALTADHDFRQRLSREADIAAELWHPHIVGIHDRGEFEGQLWLSMDFVEGTDAAELLRSRYPAGMPRAEAFEIVGAVADALDYAHLRGLLHRDIKPANILLTDTDPRERRILLADFGIARQIGDISGLTATNMVVGTTAYAAPEQLMGKGIDGRADQYALGCTAFHLLTGKAPYDDSNAAVVISQHLSAPPPLIGQRRPDLADLDAVFAKVLAKDPADRFASCSEFAAALTGRTGAGAADTVAGNAAAARTTRVAAPQQLEPAKPQRRLRPAVVLSMVATLVLAAGAVVGAELLSHRDEQTSTSSTVDTNQPGSVANPAPDQPGSVANPAPGQPGSVANPAAPPVQLASYITDPAGALTTAGRTAVEGAITRLYNRRNVHLWVAYVNDFFGLTPFRWAEETARASGFTDTDGLLAVDIANHRFTFRPPTVLTKGIDGARVDVEFIRRDRIEPAVRRHEWARAAVEAANGLETAR
ncbi:serine/threonine-protein kinase [Mycobacterium sp.]|uniref:serine/threonine-protein kinase n=1 Tax=Mycobacterium sp. TaxID=1785 RepID=UPI0031E1E5B4